MSIWTLLQIAFDILMALSLSIVWLRLKRPPEEDPRMSKGLQLLQSKISILEDLSDRTELQVKQLTTLLENKVIQVQQKISEAENQVHRVNQSVQKSKEVAEIFQDKIPHEEIIERQHTVKYVQAARLAHQGKSVDEIVRAVELPRAEIELIAKVNRDDLMFDESLLPEWVNQEAAEAAPTTANEVYKPTLGDFSRAFDVPQKEYESLKKLGDEFRQAVHKPPTPAPVAPSVPKAVVTPAAPVQQQATVIKPAATPVAPAAKASNISIEDIEYGTNAKNETVEVKKVLFPRIDVNKSLG